MFNPKVNSKWQILSNDEWQVQDVEDENKNKIKRLFIQIYNLINAVYSKIRRFVQDEKFKEIHDFEDHLVDVSVDWIGSDKGS